MYAKIYWYVVTYPNGRKQSAIVDDPSDSVHFYDGGKYYFESEGYHATTWAHEQGLKIEQGEMAVLLPIDKEIL